MLSMDVDKTLSLKPLDRLYAGLVGLVACARFDPASAANQAGVVGAATQGHQHEPLCGAESYAAVRQLGDVADWV
jgi:hypothetical protein